MRILYIILLIALSVSYGFTGFVFGIIGLLAINWIVLPILGMFMLGIEDIIKEIKEG